MFVRLKNKHGFTMIEMIIVIAIIAILSGTLVPLIGKMVRTKQIAHANANAKLVYMEVQKVLNEYQYVDDKKPLELFYGQYDGSKVIITIKIQGGSKKTFERELSLPDEVMKSSWYANVNNSNFIVDKVKWTADYDKDPEGAGGLSSISNANSYNDGVSNSKKLVGVYPQ